ncbi:hypothetical protein CONPUDRAFT_86246 [Coniophora puteana RWD-64-598 SS2]|uniref:Protein N-terminal and lysine N-methyltransferase EFM7 n=1 Tax=Coniophora puteana (strain RWD-64-598) TaxID=741705 RepID=A0A5M3N588_CONPW|nr:uncharacterized protein CONPUDRAFT_86246 [Coniophora puteana RWD-64-598 SS2]EIW86224.1 hypothetical protein CONPUDRAFT_86246 [Coniophora puteana RWD-64-598 SS2]
MDDGELSLDSVFTEPSRPPSPDPTYEVYPRKSSSPGAPSELKIRLVGSHPLWAHHLWNAARSFASYFDANPDIVRDRFVLELGAGGALPGMITVLNGAQKVVLTDYPDDALIRNIEHNISQNIPYSIRDNVTAQGYIWGQSATRLLQLKYDVIILSDLIFNHSQHDALLKTCTYCLSSDEGLGGDSGSSVQPCVLVFYTHHRPHLAHRDMKFFEKARDQGWICEEIVTEKYPPMFPEDPGEEDIRATVHGWRLVRSTIVKNKDD